MDLEGSNIIVLDIETLRSADDCRICGASMARHPLDFRGEYHQALALGWDNKPALGLSIGCYWDYMEEQLHWFDVASLDATISCFVERQPLLVSFNGIGFDFPLIDGMLREVADLELLSDRERDRARGNALYQLCDAFKVLCARSYDLLAAIWTVDPDRKFERGLNSLGAISVANGFGAKEMDGATAPRLWAAGRIAEVLNYCAGDVRKTKELFEQVVTTGTLLRGDGKPIMLPIPILAPYQSPGVSTTTEVPHVL